jgi:hypothetical protein
MEAVERALAAGIQKKRRKKNPVCVCVCVYMQKQT